MFCKGITLYFYYNMLLNAYYWQLFYNFFFKNNSLKVN